MRSRLSHVHPLPQWVSLISLNVTGQWVPQALYLVWDLVPRQASSHPVGFQSAPLKTEERAVSSNSVLLSLPLHCPAAKRSFPSSPGWSCVLPVPATVVIFRYNTREYQTKDVSLHPPSSQDLLICKVLRKVCDLT